MDDLAALYVGDGNLPAAFGAVYQDATRPGVTGQRLHYAGIRAPQQTILAHFSAASESGMFALAAGIEATQGHEVRLSSELGGWAHQVFVFGVQIMRLRAVGSTRPGDRYRVSAALTVARTAV